MAKTRINTGTGPQEVARIAGPFKLAVGDQVHAFALTSGAGLYGDTGGPVLTHLASGKVFARLPRGARYLRAADRPSWRVLAEHAIAEKIERHGIARVLQVLAKAEPLAA